MTKDQLLPIAVDLDGTLLLTDTLYESCLQLLHYHPIQVFLLPFWLARGKAYLKQKISEQITLNLSILPYNYVLIEWLKEKKALGHQVVLCTAADIKVALKIAAHLNLFDKVIGSDGQTNMAGERKQEELVRRYGEQGFVYVANANADLKVWRSAAQAVVVNAGEDLVKKAAQVSEVTEVFPTSPITINTWPGIPGQYDLVRML
jgi:phosphoserine phosphatase